MSNDVTNNPLIIDTASATVVTLNRLPIGWIRWVAAGAAAGNGVTLKTAGGRVLWESVATGANYVEAEHWNPDAPLVADGLACTTLAAGTLYIGLAYWTETT